MSSRGHDLPAESMPQVSLLEHAQTDACPEETKALELSDDRLTTTLQCGRSVKCNEMWERLNPLGFERGTFMVLWGHIDESYQKHGEGLFTLACIYTESSTWSWFELAWQNCLDKKNKELAAQGRRQITRYHASNCSCRYDEFKGWTTKEQIEFTQSLMNVFMQHPTHTIAYTINLQELAEEVPSPEPDVMGFAYGLLLKYLMLEIGQFIGRSQRYRDARVTLIHDRCDYDAVLLDNFNSMVNDPTFSYRSSFSTIASMGWQDCPLLQPADLIAYENLKEAERRPAGRLRRKSLEALLDLDSFGAKARGLSRDNIKSIVRQFSRS
jgi:hypothetical protein